MPRRARTIAAKRIVTGLVGSTGAELCLIDSINWRALPFFAGRAPLSALGITGAGTPDVLMVLNLAIARGDHARGIIPPIAWPALSGVLTTRFVHGLATMSAQTACSPPVLRTPGLLEASRPLVAGRPGTVASLNAPLARCASSDAPSVLVTLACEADRPALVQGIPGDQPSPRRPH